MWHKFCSLWTTSTPNRRQGSQTIANSRLTFIFSNGSITHNQTSIYFESPTPTPMWVPNACSFDTLMSRMHNTLQLTNDQLVDEIYYRQSFIDAGWQYFFSISTIEKWWWCLHIVNLQWTILVCWPYRIIMYHQ